jgi:two-component system phosphate regulon sensor histidine kinase PhoR
MATLTLILGIIIGISLCYWQIYRLNRQLKQILVNTSGNADITTSLPVISLVRRELASVYQTSQELTKKLEIQKSILDQSPSGYLQVDEDNQLLWCNQQARRLLNIDRWQLGQIRLLLELVRSYELDQLIEHTRNSQTIQMREWQYYPSQYAKDNHISTLPSSSGQSLTLKASSFPLPNGNVGVFLENQQPLVELSRSRERAFSDLIHELRTPLTSISLLAEALQKRVGSQEKHWLEQMSKEVERLIDLVQDWLEISCIQEKPSQYLNYQKLNLKDLILSAWDSLAPLAEQKKITLNYQGEEQVNLQGDKIRLIQVFVNLFDNGIKHSPEQSIIRVEITYNQPKISSKFNPEQKEEIVVNIIDYGNGFKEVDLPYVFERLYRGESSRMRESSENTRRGSGLGLSIVQKFIQAHGGIVEAKNHPETKGAWIQLRLLRDTSFS